MPFSANALLSPPISERDTVAVKNSQTAWLDGNAFCACAGSTTVQDQEQQDISLCQELGAALKQSYALLHGIAVRLNERLTAKYGLFHSDWTKAFALPTRAPMYFAQSKFFPACSAEIRYNDVSEAPLRHNVSQFDPIVTTSPPASQAVASTLDAHR